MKSVNSHFKGPPHRPNANDSSQTPKIDGISGLKRKTVNDSKADVGEAAVTNNMAQMNVQTKIPFMQKSHMINQEKLFRTNLEFKSSDEAMAWVVEVGKANQTIIVKYRFNVTGKGKVRTYWMYCERHGSATQAATQRCHCPFSLKCCQVDQGPWKVEVVSGWHNHEIGQNLRSNANGRLTEEKNELTKELFASQCKEKQILPQIKDKDPANLTALKEVNNARDNSSKKALPGQTILQQFLSQAWVAQHFYYKRYRDALGRDGRSIDLVFAHNDSLALLRAFPYVLIVDATFQGNRFHVPFFEVRGVVSTWKSFNVACAFVAAEREDNYVWALNHIKDMCWLAGKTPTAIVTVTNPDQALFNAIERVFPDTKHLLCRQHICKDIKDRCLKDPCATLFVSGCKALFESKTEKVYEERLAFMENDWRNKQELIGYLKQTWLTPYKDKFVSAWTDKVMHFGTHDTVLHSLELGQRPMRMARSSLVKEHLNFWAGYDAWGFLHSLLSEQTREINGSFQQSQRKLLDIVPWVDLFRLLHHGISHEAIGIMVQQYKLIASADNYPRTCVCQLRVTHGLPCAHEMAKYVADNRPIPRDAMHEFWKQISLDVVRDNPLSDAAQGSSFIDLLIELPYMSASERQVFEQIINERMCQGKPTPANLLSNESNIAEDKLLEEELCGRTIQQQFFSQPWVNKLFYHKKHRKALASDGLSSDLVFAHFESLALLRAFPYVLIVDATFQGNRFNSPFFEVRGVASTWENFNVACAFVAEEREDNYLWAFNQIKGIYWFTGKTPLTIVTVTDPNQALCNAVEQVFPNSKHLLCRHRIYKNIEDRCLKDNTTVETTSFLSACKNLFESKTEKVYKKRLALMDDDWIYKHNLVGYLKKTWLTPYKERIVSAWTDKVMHFGAITMTRDVSSVKELLNFSTGTDVWGQLHLLLSKETIQIKKSFLQAQKKHLDILPRVDAFRLLQRGISYRAVEILVQEYERVTSGDKCPSICVCQLRATHGLPCAHEIAKYVAEHRPIPLDTIHGFWRQLNLDVVPDESWGYISNFLDVLIQMPYMSTELRQEIHVFFERQKDDLISRGYTFPKTRHAQSPLGSSSSETSGSGQSHGNSTSSGQSRSCSVKADHAEDPYIHEIPNFLVPYVNDFHEDDTCGHSGFQAIANGVEYGENGWRRVRGDLFRELASRSDIYAPVFVSDTVEKVLNALAQWTTPPYLPEQWFSVPDMGHLVATHYKLVFVVLGQQCVTFLPLYVDDQAHLSDMNELCLLSLHRGKKFVSVNIDEGFPLPPVHPLWARHHHKSVDGLDRRYGDRFQQYKWFESFMCPPSSLEKLCD